MKVPFGSTLAAVAALLLAGCAGTHEVARQTAPSHVDGNYTQDRAYVSVVENIALQRGIDVTWVNPPQKRSEQHKP